ncbi:CHRD domain-containing protein [Pedobacter psychroterrae]|uniref:CHRD domain-containing protein n=1 Tax=Pedobacter psychroterrae TaxID=2530453 RepID=A0A4R0NI12_9SPHI|nr:CHRD domain-containing protein [Pedobacter psychroterrae]TCC99858.1 CHRD domain-containing protein [Pedobacter psychroterrae]
MKKISFTRISMALAVAVLLLFSLQSCKKEKAPVDLKKKAHVMFSGSQEVPANASTGTGMGDVVFDPETKIVTYSFSWQLGSAAATTTNMHFHGAEDGSDTKSSGVVIPISGFTTTSSGSISGVTPVLTETQINQLLAGKWYLNIHSSTIAAGELRGNIKF